MADATMAGGHPRYHAPQLGADAARDLQAWPRFLRETSTHEEMHRTAAVKHPLRSMTQDRNAMLTTYEHDFGHLRRMKPPPGSMQALDPGRSASTVRLPSPSPSGRSRASSSVRSRAESSVASAGLGVRPRDPVGSLGPSTHAKMRALSNTSSGPMRLSVTGWTGAEWTPHTHPHMVEGFSQKRVSLNNVCNVMNLRAPDIPFCTR